MMKNTPAHIISESSMSPYQWVVIGLCILINMLDGFDVLVMAFTAAAVSSQWSLTAVQLGYLLSAGLVGMALGSLFIAPWADRLGRRPIILLCVAIAGIGMLLSSFAPNPVLLGCLRLLTGLGIGGILASSYVIAGEYANKHWRGLAISLQSTAYALGATLGGFAAAKIIPDLGWPSVFFYGGVITLLLLPLLMLLLPESLDYLAHSDADNALERINTILRRLGREVLTAKPEPEKTTGDNRNMLAQLFGTELRSTTLLIWLTFFLVMFGFYFVMSWTPKLLTSAGLSASQGITGGVLLNLGGIVGTTLIGLLSSRVALPRLLVVYLLANALALTLFVSSTSSLSLAYSLALLIGILVNGSIAGVYALTPSLYSTRQRVTALGWAIGVGRAGAILSPIAAGYLLDHAWQAAGLYRLFALVFVFAALAIAILAGVRSRYRQAELASG